MKSFIRKSISILIAAVFIYGLVPRAAKASAESAITEAVANMTTEEKICQMLVISFGYYSDGNGGQRLSSAAQATLRKYCFGGILLFAQNTAENADTVRYIDAVQQANASGGVSRPQLLFCADQEGGTITRLGHGTQTPGNMALAANPDRSAAYTAGRIIGSELRALGISVDFAPDVDINSNPANPVIGVRSFSDNASIVRDCALKYLDGLMSTGTVAALKHFPGHGDTATDSHTGLPLVNRTYDQLKSRELIPFKACINAGAEIVMTAHIQFPKIETGKYISKSNGEEVYLPATLSKTIITDILRGDLGFNGVVITDAMEMDALKDHFDRYDAAKLAIEAGVDMLLTPVSPIGSSGISDLESYIARLVQMAENGDIPMSMIDSAVTRILRLKQRHGLTAPYNSSDLDERTAYAEATVGSAQNHAAEWAITKGCITLIKNDGHALPLTGSNEKTVILTSDESENLSMQYAVDLLRSEGRLPSGANVQILSYKDRSLDYLKEKVRDADNVIAVSEARTASYLRGSTASKLDSLIGFVHSKGGKFILLSAMLPYDAARFQDADAIMLAYSAKGMSEDPRVTQDASQQYGPNLPAAIYLMFSAAESPRGVLPVSIPALDTGYAFTDETLYPRGTSLSYSGQQPPPPTEAPSTDEPETPVPTSPDESETPEPTDPAQTPGPSDAPPDDPVPSDSNAPTGEPVPPTHCDPAVTSPADTGQKQRSGAGFVWPIVLIVGGSLLLFSAVSALVLVIRKKE